MSGDGSVGMQNVYCNAKYRGKAKSFPSIQGKNKKSWKHLELGFFLFFCLLEIGFMVCWLWVCVIFGGDSLLFGFHLLEELNLKFGLFPSPLFPQQHHQRSSKQRGRKGLKLLHGRSLVVPTGSFRGSFSKKCCDRHRIGANTSKGPRMTRSLLQIEI